MLIRQLIHAKNVMSDVRFVLDQAITNAHNAMTATFLLMILVLLAAIRDIIYLVENVFLVNQIA
jgi:hypothetical protein